MRQVKKAEYNAISTNVDKLNSNINRMSEFKEQLEDFLKSKLSEFRVDGMTVEEFTNSHNQLLAETNELIEAVTTDIDNYMSERKDAWHDSGNGEATQEWLESWQELEAGMAEEMYFDCIEVNFDVPHLECFELPPKERIQ
ncbi:hypothetical protein [Pseudoalteromonas sp. MMG024]|uniref:hypothetical protein n=1 Tax=Pseudoalteromonas sp. MMG024 TaxID=2909980 RepID=UPI001F43D4B0|nr:hypothetical protein [Pseudoalteromonas sp. MMG024]MCF6459091.1 hypothetical protein [Pseudoalteromonas sp. MMG024]